MFALVWVVTMKRNRSRKTSETRPAQKRPNTVERAEQALEKATDKPPQRTDDPSTDKAKIGEDGVLKPLKHAD